MSYQGSVLLFLRPAVVAQPAFFIHHGEMQSSEYIAFASAGTRGLVYLGALDAIEDRLGGEAYEAWQRGLRGIAGTSAGAIVALILALGFDQETRREILRDHLDIRRVISRPDLALLLRQYGCEDGEAFKETIQRILARGGLSATSTMADLKRLLRVDVVFMCTNLHTGAPLRLCASNTPQLRVCDAIYASACVPFVFAPQLVTDVMVTDGCLSCHMPEAFDESRTLFISVEEGSPSPSAKTLATWSDFLHGIVRSTVVAQKHRTDRLRVEHAARYFELKLPPEVSRSTPPFELEMAEDTACELVQAGYVAAFDILTHGRLTRIVEGVVRIVIVLLTMREEPCEINEEYPPGVSS